MYIVKIMLTDARQDFCPSDAVLERY